MKGYEPETRNSQRLGEDRRDAAVLQDIRRNIRIWYDQWSFVIEMPFNMFGSDGLLVRACALHKQVHWLVNQPREDGSTVGELDCLEPHVEESRDIASFFDELRFYGNSINGEYLCWRRDQDGSFKFHVIDGACISIRFAGTSIIDFTRRTQTSDVETLLGFGYSPLARTFEGATAEERVQHHLEHR
ncbi:MULTISPECIES: hypothetical protein [unclassified Rhizobium]|uniref:hypothetical protein n=1 Tax=unclassified Rhizobium TaxID=2613769 RepID=UPI000BCBC2EE|nr:MULTISPECIES: hypothetical protein [unclassified Rhizobium]MDH7808845.1 hypothetical protein [Rhizobium sp. AN67]MDQ4409120.1 hypothetical protein [Rhizobium sp. AN63]SOD51049.1 hypothetical protein SAMN05216595_0509 [Rhizobium sp. AN6A]